MKLIECVPNISEGRNKDVIDKIINNIKSNKNIELLDYDIGYDTNRTVITFVGEPDYVIKCAHQLIIDSYNLIDMSKHKGAHPRMGSTDVCPLIPISNVSVKECIKYSNILAKKVSESIDIPIYLYEKSALHKDRENLAFIRSGEYEGFKDKIKLPEWKPDYGKQVFNKKFGSIAIGCREFLLAYNVNLNTSNKKIATDIALDIREMGRLKRDNKGIVIRNKNGVAERVPGKFKYCKAVGWYIEEYNQAQVSINLTNFKKTSLHKVFEEVRKQARKRGVRVTGSEIVGLIPFKAIYDAGIFYLKKQNHQLGIPTKDIINIAIHSLGLNDIYKFNSKEKIIEYKIATNGHFPEMKLNTFIDNLSRPTLTPGGGSVAALGGAIGSSLASMVSNLSIAKKGLEKHINFHNDRSIKCQNNLNILLSLIDEDSLSYDNVIKALRLPKKTKKDINIRNKELIKATKHAADIPMKVLTYCNKVLSDCLDIAKCCNPNSISDIAVAGEFLKAAAYSASYNVRINIVDLVEKDKQSYLNNIDFHLKDVDHLYLCLIKETEKILNK